MFAAEHSAAWSRFSRVFGSETSNMVKDILPVRCVDVPTLASSAHGRPRIEQALLKAGDD